MKDGRSKAGRRAELLAPAGDFKTALAAFGAGADAVYCGLPDFSARAYAKNLSAEDLDNLVRVARETGKKVYVAFNTLVAPQRIESAARSLAQIASIAPDGVIIQDPGVARICRRYFPSLAMHASTQMAAHNLEGVLELAELGFRRVVLARELPLAAVESIVRRCGVEIECFVHGALCYSVSGLCLFSALERGRSGNCGECAYCCRERFDCEGGGRLHPFSMKDLRLGADARRLAAAGVASLKIEGRMKSLLYVASAVKYYRDLLDGTEGASGDRIDERDLETVFSRRTTKLYFDGHGAESPVDTGEPGHAGTPIGKVKKITKDRDGNPWLRFKTERRLERHDGLQFSGDGTGRRPGFGISAMRSALSRRNAVCVEAGTDVEVLLPPGVNPESGETVYCSMSNEVKRRFPEPSFRPAAHPGTKTLAIGSIRIGRGLAEAECGGATVREEGEFPPADNPAGTEEAARRAFSRLGGTRYGVCEIGRFENPFGLYVPASAWNALRRKAVEAAETAERGAEERIVREMARERIEPPRLACVPPHSVAKVRADQNAATEGYDEIVVAPCAGGGWTDGIASDCRIALPVWTDEEEYPALRTAVKRMLRRGYSKWEAADWAGLRLLKSLGVADTTADWTLYAANAHGLALLAGEGVRRFVASPETSGEAAESLAASGWPVEFLSRQCTPLFLSLTRPAAALAPESGFASARFGSLWATARRKPRIFQTPRGAAARTDFSWDIP